MWSKAQTVSIGSPVVGYEGGSNAFFTIFLENGETNTTGAPITGWITKSGTTSPGIDYSMSNIFSIPNGASSVVMVAVMFDDHDEECDETIIATISDLSAGSVGVDTSTTTIVDDDCPAASIPGYYPECYGVATSSTNSTFTVVADRNMKTFFALDFLGKVISSGDINSNTFLLDIGSFAQGCYFLTILFEDGNVFAENVFKF